MGFWKPKQKLQGPGYFYGRTDSGKSWKMIALAQIYHSRFRYKIWDIGGGRRNENTFWCFPSEEKKLWWNFESIVGPLTQPGPKEYKVKLLYPCFLAKLPQKVPQQLPRIETQVFTIYFKDIEPEDISLIIGDLPKSAVHMWQKICLECKDDFTGAEILDYIDRNLPKYKELSIYHLFIKPAIDNGLLAGKNVSTNLDLIAEAKERDRITALVHDYIPSKRWQMFIMNYIMTTVLFRLAMKDKIPKLNLTLFREAGDYMKKVDKDAESAEHVQIFRNKLTNVARYGRSGNILFMDTQSPSDTKNLIEGQEDLLCINEISSIDVQDIMDKLKREKRVSNSLRNKLHEMDQTQMIVVERREKAVLVKPFMPPRTMAYKSKSFNVIWKEKINSYVAVNDLLKTTLERNKEAEERIRLRKLDKKFVVSKITNNKKAKNVPELEGTPDILDKEDEEKLKEFNDEIII